LNGFAEGAFCADAVATLTDKSIATVNEAMQYRKTIADLDDCATVKSPTAIFRWFNERA
jgi:hypothetical protein